MNAITRQGAAAAGAFLGVERSFGGRRWTERAFDQKTAEAHARHPGIDPILGRLLAARGAQIGKTEAFLSPRLKDHLPDPSILRDLDRAAEIILAALLDGRKTVVFADYDVDGGTSAAQLIRYFRSWGRELGLYVPDRLKEGYGPSAIAFRTLHEQDVKLIIAVDCGANSREAMDEAIKLGVDVIVLDHHLMAPGPPPQAAALVNPNRPDCNSGLGYLAAAGVTFLIMVAINRLARGRGLFKDRAEPDVMKLLDLCALGTLCDVAQLVGANRAFAAQGLKVMSKLENVGVAALAKVAGVEIPTSVYHATYVLGPRLNAGGRLGAAVMAAQLLATDDPIEARRLAEELEVLNIERRTLEATALLEAEAQLQRHQNDAVLVAAGPWPPGVVGIVAGRIKEKFLKPAIVIGWEGLEDGTAKGSGRSVSGVNLGDALSASAAAGVLIAGGGHAVAGGLTVARDRIDEFRADINERLSASCRASQDEARALMIDGMVGVGTANVEFCERLERLGPYGAGNPSPIFVLSDVSVAHAARAGTDHVRCTFADAQDQRIRGIAFRAANTPLGEAIFERKQRLHLAVKVQINEWNGRRSAEIEILDGAPAKARD
ncbi:MAG: single-stranded-DNA-specific exonuclease RecJ [Caulobacterales bacterium]